MSTVFKQIQSKKKESLTVHEHLQAKSEAQEQNDVDVLDLLRHVVFSRTDHHKFGGGVVEAIVDFCVPITGQVNISDKLRHVIFYEEGEG